MLASLLPAGYTTVAVIKNLLVKICKQKMFPNNYTQIGLITAVYFIGMASYIYGNKFQIYNIKRKR